MSLPDGTTDGIGQLCADVRQMISEAESGTPSVDKMVETYYAVSNFVAVLAALRKSGDVTDTAAATTTTTTTTATAATTAPAAGPAVPPGAMLDVENLVSERFDKVIHPRFKAVISDMISGSMDRLRQPQGAQRGDADATGKGGSDGESAEYDMLRRLMSVKEFAEQYDSVAMRGRGSSGGGAHDAQRQNG